MGTDIHSAVEVFNGTKWHRVKDSFPGWQENTLTSEPFDQRNYGMFGFLVNERNYSHVPPLSEARGWPEDRDCYQPADDYDGRWCRSWFLLSELLEFDYSQTFEDRRCMTDGNGAADSRPGNGKIVTFREFLPKLYFRDMEIMKGLSNNPAHVRIVFGFS